MVVVAAPAEGSGAVVSSATKITGPWVRQARDVNCKVGAPICAGMPDQEVDKIRPLGQLTIPAQGIAISRLPKAGLKGEDVYLWQGMRWLSGEHNPKQCTTLCNPPTGYYVLKIQHIIQVRTMTIGFHWNLTLRARLCRLKSSWIRLSSV